MTSHTTWGFRKRLGSLPAPIQAKASEAFRTFKAHPQNIGKLLARHLRTFFADYPAAPGALRL